VRALKDTEPFVRWEALLPDEDRGTDEEVFNFITVGVNEYIAGHAVKATADVVVALEDTGGLVAIGVLPQTGLGLLGDNDGDEVVIRLQFQLMF
jgi:hypothetical protein